MKPIRFLLALIALKTIDCYEDLLDQYVRHVDYVNKIEDELSNRSHGQRYARAVFDVNPKWKDLSNKLSFADGNKKIGGEEVEAKKKIKSNFSPDLTPYLDVGGEVASNHLERRRRQTSQDLWTHSLVLEDYVVLSWQNRHQEVLFRVEARTKGWIGIGFSPNGGMENADIVIGWVDERRGRAYLGVSFTRKFRVKFSTS